MRSSVSVARTTVPMLMSAGSCLSISPPLRPRTVSTTPERASWCTTFIRWFSEIPCTSAMC